MSAFLKAVFNWTINNTTDYGSEPVAVDEEKMQWLKRAWDSFIVDGATLVKRALKMLEDGNEDDQLLVLNNLTDLVEDIDNANVLKPLGGWALVLNFAQHSPSERVRQAAVQALAAVLHNNERGVQDGIGEGLLPALNALTINASRLNIEKQLVGLLSALIQSPLFVTEYMHASAGTGTNTSPDSPQNLVALCKQLDPSSPRVAHLLSTLKELVSLEDTSDYMGYISRWLKDANE